MFEFPLTPDELFAERRLQFQGWGLPEQAIGGVEARVRDMWADAPGGWSFEWSREAAGLEEDGRLLDAALAYGAARFPCLATTARRKAYDRQVALFPQAVDDAVQRETLSVVYQGRHIVVPVHRYRAPESLATLVLTGGVDTWKVELHQIASTFQHFGQLEVVVFDMPGTGECDVALAPDGDAVYAEVIRAVRRPGVPIGAMGVSFGGHWAAKLALLRVIDFAVDIGGPIGATDLPRSRRPLANGMAGVVAHALRLDGLPSPEALRSQLERFSLARQGLLEPDREVSRLLVINGRDDVYIPVGDSTVFEQYSQAEVHVVPNAGHCAAERIGPVIRHTIAWIRSEITGLDADLALARSTAAQLA